MGYRQPRVPGMTPGAEAMGLMREVLQFLREFCPAAWAANNRRKKEIEALERRISRLEQGGEGP